MLKPMLRSLAQRVGLSYELYRVYELDLQESGRQAVPTLPVGYSIGGVTAELAREAVDPLMRDQAWYGGDGAHGFAIFFNAQPVCMQWYWYGERYRSMRGFWPLSAREAKSVQLITCPEHQGRGLATALKAYSVLQLADKGYQRAFSRIWWNNRQSIRVSEKAGWQLIAVVGLLHRPATGRSFRLAIHLDGVSKGRRVEFARLKCPQL